MDQFGIKKISKGFFVVMLNIPDEIQNQIKAQIYGLKCFVECTDLAEHSKFQDLQRIQNSFKIQEKEMNLCANGFLNSIYS